VIYGVVEEMEVFVMDAEKTLRTTGQDAQITGFLKMIRFTAVRQSVNKRRLHTSRTYSQSEISNKASMFIHIIHKLLVHNETKSEAVMRRVSWRSNHCTSNSAQKQMHIRKTNCASNLCECTIAYE